MWCNTSQYFALVNLVFPLLSGAVWYFWPETGWWPALILIVPFAAGLTSARFPLHRTPFDPLLVVFLLTAAVGVWAAYDRQAAWTKFWFILCGIILFYLIASQPEKNLDILTWGLLGFGSLVSLLFWFTQDWQAQTIKFVWLSHIGSWWQAYRPNLGLAGLKPNITAGILAMLVPIAWGCVLNEKKLKTQKRFFLALFLTGFILITMLFTASRGAWMALSISLGIWGLWAFSKGIVNIGSKKPLSAFKPQAIFAICLLSFLLIGVAVTLRFPGGLVALANRLPGPASGTTRAELFHQTLDLLQDVPFTGGGLAAFPAYYSVYIRAIPNFYYGYAHNLYLDLWFDLGVFGFMAVLGILIGAILLIHPWQTDPRVSRMSWAVTAALLVILFHGLVDDALFSDRNAILLLVPAGFAAALWSVNQPRFTGIHLAFNRRTTPLLALCLVIVCSLAWEFRHSLQAIWYANLGVVRLAQVELVGFPEHLPENLTSDQLQVPVNFFERAIDRQPKNKTALFHLGRIQTRLMDFQHAISNLQVAAQADPYHRGIRKILGYDYVWVGQFDLARDQLGNIPEAESEMKTFIWWWDTQQRQDLAQRAAYMANLLGSVTASP